MSDQAAATSVTASIVVEAPIEEAFSVFTEGIGTWWPPEYNLLEVDIAERIFEPRVGGRVFDRGVDGTECHWARMLVYGPPYRVGSAGTSARGGRSRPVATERVRSRSGSHPSRWT